MRVDLPDAARPGVVVVDGDAMERLAAPLANPERVVLVDRGDGVDLDRAFEMGIKSVVSSRDPLDTVLLAIMAARLRASRSIATERAGVPVESGQSEFDLIYWPDSVRNGLLISGAALVLLAAAGVWRSHTTGRRRAGQDLGRVPR